MTYRLCLLSLAGMVQQLPSLCRKELLLFPLPDGVIVNSMFGYHSSADSWTGVRDCLQSVTQTQHSLRGGVFFFLFFFYSL